MTSIDSMLLAWIAAFISFLVLSNCTTNMISMYHSEERQNGTCYATFGGAIGYCDATRSVK